MEKKGYTVVTPGALQFKLTGGEIKVLENGTTILLESDDKSPVISVFPYGSTIMLDTAIVKPEKSIVKSL